MTAAQRTRSVGRCLTAPLDGAGCLPSLVGTPITAAATGVESIRDHSALAAYRWQCCHDDERANNQHHCH